jgi:hypothetical protein
MDYDEIYAALGTIRIVCNEMQEKDGCRSCPLSNNTGVTCSVISEIPRNWNLLQPTVKLLG